MGFPQPCSSCDVPSIGVSGSCCSTAICVPHNVDPGLCHISSFVSPLEVSSCRGDVCSCVPMWYFHGVSQVVRPHAQLQLSMSLWCPSDVFIPVKVVLLSVVRFCSQMALSQWASCSCNHVPPAALHVTLCPKPSLDRRSFSGHHFATRFHCEGSM